MKNLSVPAARTLLLTLIACACARAQAEEAALPPEVAAQLDKQNVTWTTPSADAKGSMPIGNGDLGLNVWVEPSGDLCFFIGKSDAWNENMDLCKVGKVRVRFQPALIAKGQPFAWQLDLAGGRIVVKTGQADVVLWVDAHHNVIQVDAAGKDGRQLSATAAFEPWRTEKRPLAKGESYQERGEGFVYPDTVLAAAPGQVGWYHRNPESSWRKTLETQKLEEIAKTETDPLKNRTYGAVLRGGAGDWRSASDKTLEAKPAERLSLKVHVLTAVTDTPEAWLARMNAQADAVDKLDEAARRGAHAAWWTRFWNRSWIFMEGGLKGEAERLTRGYTLQRFVNACGGRGAYPIKFNGSLFTVDNTRYGPDYRAWGGGYWIQNTRLPYWSMLEAGDFDLMQPLFEHCMRVLPLRKLATRTYYGHDGAFFPETHTFWGTYLNVNYGTDRQNKPDGLTDNAFIRRYWVNSLELVTLMLDRHDMTQDPAFLKDTLLPFAKEITTFFDQHWKRDADGKIRFEPAQSLETWHVAVNPLPETAALRHVLPRLLAKTEDAALKAQWQKTLADLPSLPTKTDAKTGKTRWLPAEKFSVRRNIENAELYAVFPYRFGTVADAPEEREIARNTWNARAAHEGVGWQQNAIQSAMLGLTDMARLYVAGNVHVTAPGFRFPAMWGPNYDWMPDQDHGSVLMTSLQYMAMQHEGGKIYLLPAWPKTWNAHFKLHASGNTTVECKVKDGQLAEVKVTPESRRKDVRVRKGESDDFVPLP